MNRRSNVHLMSSHTSRVNCDINRSLGLYGFLTVPLILQLSHGSVEIFADTGNNFIFQWKSLLFKSR